jgi:cysteine synthase
MVDIPRKPNEICTVDGIRLGLVTPSGMKFREDEFLERWGASNVLAGKVHTRPFRRLHEQEFADQTENQALLPQATGVLK